MHEPEAFQYTILRAVPRVERGERLNVGVVLFCRRHGFLGARAELDRERLRSLDPSADPEALQSALDALVAVARGDATAGSLGRLDASDRFGWLAAPSSTVIQPSPVHTGICRDPAAELTRLFEALVG
ncbi:MAG TPA: DUF3037 domain-containing protein [Solirubrobacteraceae bacterium]|nr:DUF3037 domain-containing protein [Solirubrobacteraceae bacterium]